MVNGYRQTLIVALALFLGGCSATPQNQSVVGKAEFAQRASSQAADSAVLESIHCLSIKGSPVQHFITGSVHFPLFFKLEVSPRILALVGRTDVLLLEATLPPIREELVESERLRKTLGEFNPPLSDKVLEKIDKQLGRDRQISRQAWLRTNPIAINQGLEDKIGFPRPRGLSLDAQFVRAARRGNKDIDGIEQMKEQVLIVNQVSAQQWQEIFEDQISAIGNPSRRAQLLESLRMQYRTVQDAQWDQFDAVMRSQDHYLSMLTLAVSDTRNETLAARILNRLRADRRSHFIALGAAHLGGERGVLNLLRASEAVLEKNCDAAALTR